MDKKKDFCMNLAQTSSLNHSEILQEFWADGRNSWRNFADLGDFGFFIFFKKTQKNESWA